MERRRLFFAGLPDQTFDFDGKLTFDGGAGSRFTDVQVQGDGKIVALGQVAPAVQSPPQFARYGVFRFNDDGQPDFTFGGGDGIAEIPNTWDWSAATLSLSLLADGRIAAGGHVYFGGITGVARFTPEGSPDPTFAFGAGVAYYGGNYGDTGPIDFSRVAFAGDGSFHIVGGDPGASNFDPGLDVYHFHADGSRDYTYGQFGVRHISTPSDAQAIDTVLTPSGKLLLSGVTTSSGGFFARLTTAGALDTGFGGGDGIVQNAFGSGVQIAQIVPLAGDAFFAAGYKPGPFPPYDDWSLLRKYTAAGALDTTWGLNNSGERSYYHESAYFDLAVQGDGKLIVLHGKADDFTVSRLGADGVPDTTYGNNGTTAVDFAGGDDSAIAVALDPAGRAVVAGSASLNALGAIARLNGNAPPTGTVTAHVARDVDGDGVRDAGTDTPISGRTVFVDVNSNGTFDAGTDRSAVSDAGGNVTITDVPAGTYYVVQIVPSGWKYSFPWNGGQQVTVSGFSTISAGDFLTTPITPPAHLDSTFGTGGSVLAGAGNGAGLSDSFAGVERLSNGKLVTAGYIGSVFTITRYNANGTPDTTFGPSGRVTPALPSNLYPFSAVTALQSDGKLLVSAVKGNPHLAAVIRFNADGSLDTSFGSGGGAVLPAPFAGTYLDGIAVDSLGRIVAASSTNADSTDAAVARLTSTGQPDNTFDTDGVVTHNVVGFSDSVYGLAVQADNKIVLAGVTFDGHNYGYLLRLGETGAKDGTFGTGGLARLDLPGGSPNSWKQVVWNDVKVMSDGRLVAGGYIDGALAVARYTTAGVIDSTFAAGAGYATASFQRAGAPAYAFGESLALLGDGSIYLAGSAYTTTDNATDVVAARFRRDGTLETAFGAGGKTTAAFGSFSDRVEGAVVDPTTGRLVVAGSVSGYDQAALLARFAAPAPARIGGFIFDDTDGDGVRDGGENFLVPGRTAYIDENNNAQLDPTERSFVTNVDGFWFNDLSPGTYRIRAVIPSGYAQTTPANNAAHVVTVTAGQQASPVYIGLKTDGQTPYFGLPFGIDSNPVTIQFEDFDNGGEGVAYHDVEAANNGGQYRSTGVDISTTTDASGYYVGFVKAGEWLEYSIDVQQAGSYTLDLRLAAASAGGRIHAEIDGADQTGLIVVPNTGGFQNWTTVTKTGVNLPAGAHVLRVFMDTAGSNGSVANLNWLKLTAEATPPPAWLQPQAGAQYTLTATTLTVASGTIVLSGDASTTHPDLVVSVQNNGVLMIDAAQRFESLTLADGALAAIIDGPTTTTIALRSLTVAGQAAFDLKDNALLVNYTGTSPLGSWTGSAYTGITGRIASARNGPGGSPWNGFGLLSSTAAQNGLTTLAIDEASHALNLTAPQTTLWLGQTADATTVLVKYTWAGDANLDGKINIDDYGQIDFSIAQPTPLLGWTNGDFNYDGKINIDDYGIIDFNVTAQAGASVTSTVASPPPAAELDEEPDAVMEARLTASDPAAPIPFGDAFIEPLSWNKPTADDPDDALSELA